MNFDNIIKIKNRILICRGINIVIFVSQGPNILRLVYVPHVFDCSSHAEKTFNDSGKHFGWRTIGWIGESTLNILVIAEME